MILSGIHKTSACSVFKIISFNFSDFFSTKGKGDFLSSSSESGADKLSLAQRMWPNTLFHVQEYGLCDKIVMYREQVQELSLQWDKTAA